MLEASISIDADHAEPDFALDCLAAVLARLDARPEPLRITVDAPPGMVLDIDPADGRIVLSFPGRATRKRDFRRRWIADHSVPLSLARRLVPPFKPSLVATPAGGNRVRVRETFFSRLSFLISRALVYFAPCRKNGT